MNTALKEMHNRLSKGKENGVPVRSLTIENPYAPKVGGSHRKLKQSLMLIHSKLDTRHKKPREDDGNPLTVKRSLRMPTDLSASLRNNSLVSKDKASLFLRKKATKSILSKDDSRVSNQSERKGLSNLTFKREFVKAAKRLVPPEFVTIKTILEISSDLPKARAIFDQLSSTDKEEFDEFFKKRQIKTKRGLFRKAKFAVLIEVDGFLARSTNTSLELNYYGLEILRRNLTKFCFVAYTRNDQQYMERFRELLADNSSPFDHFLSSSHCYIYEDKQLKNTAVVKEACLMIDSDLSTLYMNKENMVYLPRGNSTEDFERFNAFMEQLYGKLIERNFKLREVLPDTGYAINY